MPEIGEDSRSLSEEPLATLFHLSTVDDFGDTAVFDTEDFDEVPECARW